MTFTPVERAACYRLVQSALEEDLGEAGDVTSQAIIPADAVGQAALVARAAGVLCGLEAAQLVFAAVDSSLQFESFFGADGYELRPGMRLAKVSGSLRSILAAERTALNFVQHLSGVATLTRQYVDAIADFPNCWVLDTRKTLPGWRVLEKYAVLCGGGYNHRAGLYDGILIKDNHLAGLRGEHAIGRAIQAARARAGNSMQLIIEVDGLEQLDEALWSGPDVVLLDNMSPEKMKLAVDRRNAIAPRVLLEASGSVTLENVAAIAASGVERISVGALTHSAPALDIGLDYLP